MKTHRIYRSGKVVYLSDISIAKIHAVLPIASNIINKLSYVASKVASTGPLAC